VVPHAILVIEQGKFDIAMALPLESATVPAEESTVEPDGTSRAQKEVALCWERAKDIGALRESMIANTTAVPRAFETCMAVPRAWKIQDCIPVLTGKT
jgi:hypothetical protein